MFVPLSHGTPYRQTGVRALQLSEQLNKQDKRIEQLKKSDPEFQFKPSSISYDELITAARKVFRSRMAQCVHSLKVCSGQGNCPAALVLVLRCPIPSHPPLRLWGGGGEAEGGCQERRQRRLLAVEERLQ